jgi:flagellar M-ring protein FliF
MAKDSLYTEARQPAKASVLVKLRPGARLSPQNVAAICQLTAGAVPELAVEQVSLVDTNGTLLNRPRRAGAGDGSDASEAALEYRKSVEKEVQNKIASTLEPLLGGEHFRAGVSAEVNLNSGDQSEEIYDPTKSALVTSQKTEDGPALPLASGAPGTPSSLPRATSGAGTTSGAAAVGSSRYSRKTESMTYQTSRTIKHTKIPQGSVTKLSLSVLVDHSLRWEGPKRVVEAPSAEKLKVIRDLVAAAVGFDMNRGDQLVVEAFPFEATMSAEPPSLGPAPPPPASSLPPWLQKLMASKNFTLFAGIGAAALLLLFGGLIFLVMKSLGKKSKITADVAHAALAGAQAKELTSSSGEDVQRQLEAQMAEQAALHAKKEAEELMKLKIPAVSTKKTEVLTKHIVAETKKDPILMAQVVRSWLNDQKRR